MEVGHISYHRRSRRSVKCYATETWGQGGNEMSLQEDQTEEAPELALNSGQDSEQTEAGGGGSGHFGKGAAQTKNGNTETCSEYPRKKRLADEKA